MSSPVRVLSPRPRLWAATSITDSPSWTMWNSSTLTPSHVLEAMGVLSHGNVRVSLHRGTTDAQVDRFLAELPGIVAELRAQAGVVGL